MKKLFLIAVMAIMTLSVSAQTNETIEFMSIPIDGHKGAFRAKLEAKGFTHIQDYLAYKGTFMSQDVILLVSSTPTSKKVHTVSVIFGKETSWISYKNAVDKLADTFTIKYGEPQKIEKYIYPFEQGDGHELTALRADKLTYAYNYDDEIMIFANKDYGVVVTYINKGNSKLGEWEQKALDMDDI